MVERRIEVTPASPFRMPRLIGRDGVMRRRGTVLHRLLHVDDGRSSCGRRRPRATACCSAPRARTRARVRRGDRRGCASGSASTTTCARSTRRFRDDPLIGPVVRAPAVAAAAAPARAVRGAGLGDHRAAHRLPARRGDPAADRRAPRPRCAAHRPARRADARPRLAAQAPARLAVARPRRPAGRWRWSGPRARSPPAASTCATPDHERGWRRLRAIPAIGPWTLEILALHGQGRHDQVPAGDLNLLKLVGRLRTRRQPARPRHRGRGPGVLRALRALGAAWPATYALSSPRLRTLARQELGGQRPPRILWPLEQVVLDHPLRRRPPTRRRPSSRTARSRPRGRRPAASRARSRAAARGRGRGWPPAAASTPLAGSSRSASCPRARPCRKRRSTAPRSRGVLLAGDDRRARCRSARRASSTLRIVGLRLRALELDALVVPERAERRVDAARRSSPA